MMLLDLDGEFFENFLSSNNRKIIHEEISNNQNLLVTIGDSWTWGDSIDGIHVYSKPDSPARLEKVYGKKIKNQLDNYDWINIGYPGTGNRWIVDVALRFPNILSKLSYEKIIIICVLSDSTRDTHYATTELKIQFDEVSDLYKQYEKILFDRLLTLDSIKNLNLVVARNFTNTHEENLCILKNHLPDNWVEFSRCNWSTSGPKLPEFIGYLTSDEVQHHKVFGYKHKKWLLDVNFPIAEKVTNFLMKCPLHYKIASKHPTEENHQLWADYLVQYMLKKQILSKNDAGLSQLVERVLAKH